MSCFVPYETGRSIYLPPDDPDAQLMHPPRLYTYFPDGRKLYIETYYIDPAGKFVPAAKVPSSASVCDAGSMYVLNSPLSLIWDEKWNLDDDVRTVSFPLNPSQPGRYFFWKASAKAPLVVWDPEHTGKITSAAQLFGNWTWGGKKTARNDVSALADTARAAAGPWSNAYEALATLDTNFDHEISGDELLPLGLWFDRDQDGVADAGEVLPITNSGVTKLFYEGARSVGSAAGSDVALTVGYEQNAGSSVKRGRSIDWYSAPANDGAALLGHVIANSEGPEQPMTTENVQKLLDEALPLPAKDSASKDMSDPLFEKLSSSWRWYFVDPSGKKTPVGYITFGRDAEKRITGAILNAFTVPWASGYGIFQMSSLYVKRRSDNEGSFVLFVPNGGRVENAFKVSQDGLTMLGSSKATTRFNGSSMTFSYNWIAEKTAPDEGRASPPPWLADYDRDHSLPR
jgi:hypothetical protein